MGFDEVGRPHLRIEHRVASAGPTLKDVIANTVLFLGMIQGLVKHSEPIELSFVQARDNFYQSAKYGLKGQLIWNNKEMRRAGTLAKENYYPLLTMHWNKCP